MSRLPFAVDQIVAARAYTLELLAQVDQACWFDMPGGVSHIAWQVGHLAMAEYRLALERLRGAAAGDASLLPDDLLRLFGKGSVPSPRRDDYPAPPELLNVLERVHHAALAELAEYPDAQLDLPPHKPHRLFDTRIGSLWWCARHEMLHAGQIGLLRRQLGVAPLW